MDPDSGGRSVDPRTDVWSLGSILFEMLAGSKPFPATSVMEKLAAALLLFGQAPDHAEPL